MGKLSKAEKKRRAAALNASLNSDSSSSSISSSPPSKASRIEELPTAFNVQQHFQSAEAFSAHLHALLPDKFNSLTPDNRALVDCIGTAIYSVHSHSHNSLLSKFNEQQATIQTLNNQISNHETELVKHKDEIAELMTIVNDLRASQIEQQKHSKKLEAYIDSLDSYQRRETLILSEEDIPKELSNEDSAKVALNLIKSKLNYDLPPECISIAHRLGPKSEKKRPIIVKFVRRSLQSKQTVGH